MYTCLFMKRLRGKTFQLPTFNSVSASVSHKATVPPCESQSRLRKILLIFRGSNYWTLQCKPNLIRPASS
jgi:hypothetical protein